MSNSHRKMIDEGLESYSFTEEFQTSKKKDEANRTRKKVELGQSSKQNLNPSKEVLKKFLNDQGAKICKRRQKSSSCKKKRREGSETNEKMTALQGELSEMKKVIKKIVLNEVKLNPMSVGAAKEKEKYSIEAMKKDYQLIIQEKDLELQIQIESKARLEEAHIQSQLFAQQTREFSQTIKKELEEVAIKHVHCERRQQQIQLLNQQLKQFRNRQEELLFRVRAHQQKETELQNRLIKQSCSQKEEINRLNQCLLMRDRQVNELMVKNLSLEKNISEKEEHFLALEVEYSRQIQAQHTRQILVEEDTIKALKEKETQISILQQKISILQAENENRKATTQEDSISERKMVDFCSTSRVESTSVQSRLSLPESKVVTDGLSNMERKCQELYRQIRQEKQKLNNFEGQEKKMSKEVKLLEKESLSLKENNMYLQQILVIKEKTIKDLHQNYRKLQIRMTEVGELQSAWQAQKNGLNQELRESLNSKEASEKLLSLQLQQLQKQLLQQKQRSQQIISKKGDYEAEIRELKEGQKKIRQLEGEVRDFRERESKNCVQKAKLMSEIAISQREINLWKQKHFGLELAIQSLKKRNEELESILTSIEKHNIELLEQSRVAQEDQNQNHSELKRCQSQLSKISEQIRTLNGRVLMAQQIIQLLKSQVQGYQQTIVDLEQANREQTQRMSEKMQQFCLQSDHQVKYLRMGLEDISIHKRDLQVQLNRLKEDNQVLTLRLNTLNIELGQWVPKQSFISLIEEINSKHHLQISDYECEIQQLKAYYSQQLQQKQLQYTSLVAASLEQKTKLDLQIQDLNARLKISAEQFHKQSIDLETKSTILGRIQVEIMALKQQRVSNEEKRLTAIDEIAVLEQELQNLRKRNSKLQQQSITFKNSVKIQEQKISILASTIGVLEEKEKAYLEHLAQLRSDVEKLKQKQKITTMQVKQQAKEAEKAYQQSATQLQDKIEQLGAQLHQYQTKCFEQGEQLASLQARAAQLESILKQSHSLLTQERAQRQNLAVSNKKLLFSIQKYQLHLATRQKELDTSKKQQQLLASKLSQAQEKHRQLRKRWQSSEHQRHTAAKEVQSQAISLRVLREQNRNIEKVMGEQLSQRKAIIEQLVTQKKTLYSHLSH